MISLYEDSPLLIIPDSLTQENLDCFVSFKIEVSKNGAVLIKMKETGKEYSFASLPAQLRVPEGVFDILYGTEGDEENRKAFFFEHICISGRLDGRRFGRGNNC